VMFHASRRYSSFRKLKERVVRIYTSGSINNIFAELSSGMKTADTRPIVAGELCERMPGKKRSTRMELSFSIIGVINSGKDDVLPCVEDPTPPYPMRTHYYVNES
jgi:hypothetical protein